MKFFLGLDMDKNRFRVGNIFDNSFSKKKKLSRRFCRLEKVSYKIDFTEPYF